MARARGSLIYSADVLDELKQAVVCTYTHLSFASSACAYTYFQQMLVNHRSFARCLPLDTYYRRAQAGNSLLYLHTFVLDTY